ncbi:MAG: hypothetical protein FWE33_07710 [Defluviitaleaceae bacterium]|nr:hypothetical protein [Defluviitaleaceae bacterium]
MNEVLATAIAQADVNQAASLVRNMFTEKYIAPIQKAVQAENKRIKKNPCKNTRLLEALKPFVDNSTQQSLASAIDMLHTIQTIQGINKSVVGANVAPVRNDGISTSSIHTDGIYDIDPVCAGVAPQNNIFPMLLMFLLMGR